MLLQNHRRTSVSFRELQETVTSTRLPDWSRNSGLASALRGSPRSLEWKRTAQRLANGTSSGVSDSSAQLFKTTRRRGSSSLRLSDRWKGAQCGQTSRVERKRQKMGAKKGGKKNKGHPSESEPAENICQDHGAKSKASYWSDSGLGPPPLPARLRPPGLR